MTENNAIRKRHLDRANNPKSREINNNSQKSESTGGQTTKKSSRTRRNDKNRNRGGEKNSINDTQTNDQGPPKSRSAKRAAKKHRKDALPQQESAAAHSRDNSERRRPRKPAQISLNRIRVIPMGGIEEVGRNMIIIEVGHDIFVVDVGFEFTSDTDSPGIDYILPNTKYLEARRNRIKAVFISHAHLDHIGGIPFIMDRIGNPPIYTRKFSAMMIEKRQEEFSGRPKLNIKIIEPSDGRFKVGSTFVSTFDVTHSIPDAMGIKIETPEGNIIISGDLKLDHNDGVPVKRERDCFGGLGKENNLLFIADSTNAERPGFSLTEREVQSNIAEIIRNVKDRLIIGTFASQISRMVNIIKIASECGKKVVLEGRSIRANLEIAEKYGIVTLAKNLVIEAKEIVNYPSSQIIILATGAQGEEFASLNRIASNKHNQIKLRREDSILLSSSIIPGNEKAVQALKDNLFLSGLNIIHYRTSDVHSTGHGNAGELLWMNKQIGARYFMPGYGYRSMIHAHAEVVIGAGFPRENVILAENGSVIDLSGGALRIEQKKIDAEIMIVDGNRIGDLQPDLIRERQLLAEHGIVNIIVTVLAKSYKLKKKPDIISCGFFQDSRHLFGNTKKIVSNFVKAISVKKEAGKQEGLERNIEDRVSKYLFEKTSKKPIVIATIIEIH